MATITNAAKDIGLTPPRLTVQKRTSVMTLTAYEACATSDEDWYSPCRGSLAVYGEEDNETAGGDPGVWAECPAVADR